MRPFTFIIILILQLPLQLYGQYFVVKVVDQVYLNGEMLKQRDKLPEEAELRFSSTKAYVHVLSPSKGAYILSGKSAKKNAKGEFFLALKNAIIPYDQFLAAATRSTDEEIILADQFDLKAFFRGKICLLDSFFIDVKPDHYPINEQSHFAIVHQVKRKKISRLLPRDTQQLQFLPQIMLNKRGADMSAKITHSYLEYTHPDGSTEKFGPFQLCFLNPEEQATLKKDLAYQYELAKTENKKDFLNRYAIPYALNYYGYIPPAHLRALLEDLP